MLQVVDESEHRISNWSYEKISQDERKNYSKFF